MRRIALPLLALAVIGAKADDSVATAAYAAMTWLVADSVVALGPVAAGPAR